MERPNDELSKLRFVSNPDAVITMQQAITLGEVRFRQGIDSQLLYDSLGVTVISVTGSYLLEPAWLNNCD